MRRGFSFFTHRRWLGPLLFAALVAACLAVGVFGQERSGKVTLSASELDLTRAGWRYHPGDDPRWAAPDFEDRAWPFAETTQLLASAPPPGGWSGIGWFRLRLDVAPELTNRPLGLSIEQWGASEIYLDGKLIRRTGAPAGEANAEQAVKNVSVPFDLHIEQPGPHVLAIRFSCATIETRNTVATRWRIRGLRQVGFETRIGPLERAVERRDDRVRRQTAEFIGLACLYAAFAFIHLLIHFRYPRDKANLWFGLFAVGCVVNKAIVFILASVTLPVDTAVWLRFSAACSTAFFIVCAFLFLYDVFRLRLSWHFKLFICAWPLFLLGSLATSAFNPLAQLLLLYTIVEALRVVAWAVWKRATGAAVIGVGVLFYAISPLMTFIETAGGNFEGLARLLLSLTEFGGLLCFSTYLATTVVRTSRRLDSLNQTLEAKVEKRTEQLKRKTEEVEDANRRLVDSLTYAERIQNAILPDGERIRRALAEYFVLYRPKDIVSGDFYWFQELEDGFLLAVGDCTGHGVPGALMAMIGDSLISQIAIESRVHEPSEILDQLHAGVRRALRQEAVGRRADEGMDIAMLRVERSTGKVTYAGARRPLYYVTPDGALGEARGDRLSIGGRERRRERISHHTRHELSLPKGTMVYLATDGYADQSGPEGKFGTRRFKALLASLANLPVAEQLRRLESELDRHASGESQRDDIAVFGVRL